MNVSRSSAVAVLAIGSELLDGRTLERNVQYIASELHARGIPVLLSMQCGDVREDIIACLDFILSMNVRTVCISGGLGPTVDDRTRQTIAEFAGVPLERDPAVIARLKAWFEKRGRPFAESNALQADRPAGAQWLENNYGTAPGFLLHVQRKGIECTLLTFPGIPSELRGMFQEQALPFLATRLPFSIAQERVLKIFGLPESTANDRIQAVGLSPDIEIIFSVLFPVITIVLRSEENDSDALDAAQESVAEALGREYIFARGLQDTLPATVVAGLIEHSLQVAVAESCTGGMLGSLLTSVPGASSIFQGGVISYSNVVKEDLLGVQQRSLNSAGAVSAEVALQMASGVRERLHTDIGVSVTGIAGPGGGSDLKPVGTVYIALVTGSSTFCKEYHFPFDRERFRKIAAYTALDLIRRSFSGSLDD